MSVTFQSTSDLESFVTSTDYTDDNSLCFALEILNYDTVNNNYQIAIRYDNDYIPSTNNNAYSWSTQVPDWSDYNTTLKSGILYTMSTITDYLLQSVYVQNKNFSVAYVPMMTQTYPNDSISSFINSFLPIIFLLSFLLPLLMVVYQMAEEKESKLKAIMKMMGLRESTYILSWYF